MTAAVYDFYGLALATEIRLPFDHAEPGRAPDLEAVWGGRGETPPMSPWRVLEQSSDGWLLRYVASPDDWGAFRYRRAERRLELSGVAPLENFLQPLIGPVAALLLREAGRCVLHGAVVARGDQAIAFLGPSGSGKSTLAAALVGAGCELVSDDVLAIAPGSMAVAWGPDVLGLAPDALARFAGEGADVRPRPRGSKSWLRVRAGRGAPPRLSAALILETPDPRLGEVRQAELAPREATIALMRNLYGGRWMGGPTAADLRSCAAIAAAAPVRRLWRPHDLAGVAASATALWPAVASPGEAIAAAAFPASWPA